MTKTTPHRFDANGTERKHCSKCKDWKAVERFFKAKDKWDGLRSSCKDCCQKYSKEYNKKNAKKIAERKAYKWRNDAKYREANKRCNRAKYQTDSAYREKWKKHSYERSQRPEVKKQKLITNKERIEKMRRNEPQKYKAHLHKKNTLLKKKTRFIFSSVMQNTSWITTVFKKSEAEKKQ